LSELYHPIDEKSAEHAKRANSFYDYKQGSATAEYRAAIDVAVEIANVQKARVDPMYHDKIDRLLAGYARKMAENQNARHRIEGRVPSAMISGRGNFPTAQKHKQNEARDRNMREYKHIQGLLEKIQGVGTAGISADDPAALDKLKEKLSGLEEWHNAMKAVNVYYRKYNTLDGAPYISDDVKNKLNAQLSDTRYGRQTQPYSSWALSNSNAEIKRIRDRVAALERMAERPPEGWAFDGGEVVINQAENRLQVLFDDKPNEEMRGELKRNGFRWAPSQGAWQRQLTDNALRSARRIQAIAPAEVKKPIHEQIAEGAKLAEQAAASAPAQSATAHDEQGNR